MPRTPFERTAVLLRLPVEKKKWLDQRAADEQRTVTQVLIRALDAEIKKHQRNVDRRRA